jgi:hypothetical protein
LEQPGVLPPAHVELARALGGGWRGAAETPVFASRKEVTVQQ